jgi:hypothetical protein
MNLEEGLVKGKPSVTAVILNVTAIYGGYVAER